MAMSMPDSVTPGNLPPGYDAYAGYCDGIYNTEAELRARFPSAELLIFTVTGGSSAHGVKIVPGADAEPGNVNAQGAALWALRQLRADPQSRPVVYADLASPGYSMSEVLAELAALGIGPDRVRKLTAHYDGSHVCSPGRGCRDKDGQVITFTADGTQWTSEYPGVGGSLIDMSLLADDFFGIPTPPSTPNWTETTVKELPLVKLGDPDVQAVRTVQGLLCARGHAVTVDGAFGPATDKALRDFQQMRGLTVDGVAGPVTWRALLGVA